MSMLWKVPPAVQWPSRPGMSCASGMTLVAPIITCDGDGPSLLVTMRVTGSLVACASATKVHEPLRLTASGAGARSGDASTSRAAWHPARTTRKSERTLLFYPRAGAAGYLAAGAGEGAAAS